MNWVAYEYSAYRRQRSLEIARKTWHENLLQLQEHLLHAQQNGGVVTPHVASDFGLQGNSTITGLIISVALPPTIPSLSGGATPPSGISSLKLLHPPLSLAPHCHPAMQPPKTLKVEGSSSKKVVASTMKSHTVLQATAP